jgi:hypothetical protein
MLGALEAFIMAFYAEQQQTQHVVVATLLYQLHSPHVSNVCGGM